MRTRGVAGVEGVPGTLAKSEERDENSKAGGEEATDISLVKIGEMVD